ncbi:MAG: uracil phosphoribosyltransferase [Armatimonadetes bacterium]|jgi:uracil phosphoribosyltransferase|nr:uracil phosphoribosyltransferase [Armatimonadota bacterium]
MTIQLCTHPLAQHLLTGLRSTETDPQHFRPLARRLTTLLALEATQDLPMVATPITTPLEPMEGRVLAQGLVVIPILRAGLAMLEPFMELFPNVSVGYIGLERDHATAVASSYYCKLPNVARQTTLVVDPMLATGGSANQAIELVKAAGGTDVRLVCVVAAPEGVAAVNAAHPDVPLYAASLDRQLNDKKYICPGLGDFGDRLYGTL